MSKDHGFAGTSFVGPSSVTPSLLLLRMRNAVRPQTRERDGRVGGHLLARMIRAYSLPESLMIRCWVA